MGQRRERCAHLPRTGEAATAATAATKLYISGRPLCGQLLESLPPSRRVAAVLRSELCSERGSTNVCSARIGFAVRPTWTSHRAWRLRHCCTRSSLLFTEMVLTELSGLKI